MRQLGGDAPERCAVAVDRREAELLFVGFGQIGEIHAEELPRGGERVGDRGVVRDVRERVEAGGRW